MNRCFYCGKKLAEDTGGHWHPACSRKFFGTTIPPEVSLSLSELELLANRTIEQGTTVPGVQRKLSLGLEKPKGGPKRLTLVGKPTGFILKPPTSEYAELPEAEDMVMHMADAVKIATVPHALLSLADGSVAYIVKRIDRKGVRKLPMEDFCQLSGRLTEDKYRGSYEQCAKILEKWSARALLDITILYSLLLFCFATGNSDMHLKNFSLIEDKEGRPILSPAYDLLPTQILIPEDMEETALTLCGRKSNLRRKTFEELGTRFGLMERVVKNLLEELIESEGTLHAAIETSFASSRLQEKMHRLLSDRMEILKT